jgi:hypothetical protein
MKGRPVVDRDVRTVQEAADGLELSCGVLGQAPVEELAGTRTVFFDSCDHPVDDSSPQ